MFFLFFEAMTLIICPRNFAVYLLPAEISLSPDLKGQSNKIFNSRSTKWLTLVPRDQKIFRILSNSYEVICIHKMSKNWPSLLSMTSVWVKNWASGNSYFLHFYNYLVSSALHTYLIFVSMSLLRHGNHLNCLILTFHCQLPDTVNAGSTDSTLNNMGVSTLCIEWQPRVSALILTFVTPRYTKMRRVKTLHIKQYGEYWLSAINNTVAGSQ
jgi:hypothetical protein